MHQQKYISPALPKNTLSPAADTANSNFITQKYWNVIKDAYYIYLSPRQHDLLTDHMTIQQLADPEKLLNDNPKF